MFWQFSANRDDVQGYAAKTVFEVSFSISLEINFFLQKPLLWSRIQAHNFFSKNRTNLFMKKLIFDEFLCTLFVDASMMPSHLQVKPQPTEKTSGSSRHEIFSYFAFFEPFWHLVRVQLSSCIWIHTTTPQSTLFFPVFFPV